MDSVRKCPKCGLDLTDASAKVCLRHIAGGSGRGKIWIGALTQFAFAAIFMTVFHFPKFMIGIFGGMILVGTLLSSFVKPSSARRPEPSRPLAHPVLFRFVGAGIALCTVAIVGFLLFGFVIFMNSWDRWHRYEGQPYHRSEFQVEQVYWQHHSKSTDVYARGTVEGQGEWMSLQPYLHTTPRSQAELESRVPVGVVIPVYFFPGMKGRARVQVFQDVPPAEAGHRAAITAVNDSLLGLAIAGGMLFLLTRVRRRCYADNEVALQAG